VSWHGTRSDSRIYLRRLLQLRIVVARQRHAKHLSDGCNWTESYVNPEHDGLNMWQSAGEAIAHAEFLGCYNDMTAGCSGGPWLVWREGAVFAKGLNSFRFDGESDRMHSPHFGEAFVNLIKWAEEQTDLGTSDEKE
jgi:hypothetical protein